MCTIDETGRPVNHIARWPVKLTSLDAGEARAAIDGRARRLQTADHQALGLDTDDPEGPA
jgi:hypothetical protein